MILPYLMVALIFTVTSISANDECADGNGFDYRGKIAVTRGGLICQRWSMQYPYKHDRTPQNYPYYGLDENYCRNPDGEERPWCYTTGDKRWDYCGVPICSTPTKHCYSGNGAFYRGIAFHTKSVIQCQPWNLQYPHKHTRTSENYPDADLRSNYCRNPDGEDRPWCYTLDPDVRWGYCNVKPCPL